MKMSVHNQQREIIINRSKVPILRAGFSNLIFILLIITLIFVNQILNDFHITLFPRMFVFLIIILVALKVYWHSISRLCIRGGEKLVLLGPIIQSTIDISNIEKVEISGIPSSMAIIFMIKMKNTALPRFYFFIAVSTNYGSYQDTKAKLIELLARK